MNKEKNNEDSYKKNIKRYLYIVLMEVFAVGFALILLGEYKGGTDSSKTAGKVTGNDVVAASFLQSEQETTKAEKEPVDDNNDSTLNDVKENQTTIDSTDNAEGTENIDGKDNTVDTTSTSEDPDNSEGENTVTEDKAIEMKLTNKEKQQLKEVNEIIENMTLEEKISQMFIVSPEELTNYYNVTVAGTNTKNAINKYHVAGVIYFSGNIKSESQLTKLLTNTQQYATANNGIPMFLGIDEEGGEVARIANNPSFNVTKFDNLSTVSSKEEAYKIGSTIGEYLSKYGFNLDFAPTSDILTNKKNTVVRNRSFSSSSKIVVEYASAYTKGLNDEGMYASYKHFPGHGATAEDSHEGFAYTDKTYEQLEKADLVPFIDGIKNGIDMIMVGHISVPKVIGDNTPSSLSKVMVTDILREKLGYEGVIITDAMNMGAISKNYTIEQSTSAAVKAGCDLILMPADFRKAYNGLLKSVKNGEISEKQIEDSVRRVLLLKQKRMEW